MQTATITLDFGTVTTIKGTATCFGDGPVMVTVTSHPKLPRIDAESALRSAVRDGRCKLPDSIRAAIDNGAAVL